MQGKSSFRNNKVKIENIIVDKVSYGIQALLICGFSEVKSTRNTVPHTEDISLWQRYLPTLTLCVICRTEKQMVEYLWIDTYH